MNLYAYVEGDPVNWVDPAGQFAWLPIIKITLEVAGGLTATDYVLEKYYVHQTYKYLEQQKQYYKNF